MQILWGAVRAVSIETMGVLVVLWMLYGATALAIDAPWWATKSRSIRTEQRDVANMQIARVEPEEAGSRIQRERDRMERQNVDYRHRLRAGFLKEAERHPDQIVVVNASQSIDQVHSNIQAATERLLEE